MTFRVWILLLTAMLFYGVGEWASKHYADTGGSGWGWLAMFAYACNAWIWLFALCRFNCLSVLGSLWNVGYAIVTVLLALVVFHERVSAVNMVGIVFGVIAVLLLSL